MTINTKEIQDVQSPILDTRGILETLAYDPKYFENNPEEKEAYGLHWGQRKLLLSEIQFLAQHLDKLKYVIYAGAAPGNKAFWLSQLFPSIKFILVDPVPFQMYLDDGKVHRWVKHPDIVHLTVSKTKSQNRIKSNYYSFMANRSVSYDARRPNDLNKVSGVKLTNMIKNTNYKVYVIEDLFTDSLAEKLKKLGDSLFISDIRSFTPSHGNKSGEITDLSIMWDMCQQMIWMKILNPVYSMVKFRGMYYDDVSQNAVKAYNEHDPRMQNLRSVFDSAKIFGIDFISNYGKKIIEYFPGTQNIQAWAPHKSGEVRLHISRENLKTHHVYDQVAHDDSMFWFNIKHRPWVACHNPAASKQIGFDHCQDCALECEIWKAYLIWSNKQVSNRSIQKLVQDANKNLRKSLKRGGHGHMFPSTSFASK